MKAIPALALIAAGTVLVTSTPLCASETDDRIESSFSKSYAYRIYLKDDAIKTESRNGVVSLYGQVNVPSHKYMAEVAVADVPGVKRV
ncbi:MAG: BON domain-containing protein, partial [Verrucomicrobia bacterium]|nr:BON domain-containing protein [Verrucomicrobiota bacterium]